MHINHRRKNKYNPGNNHWCSVPSDLKRWYWKKARARQREAMETGRYDDFQDLHPNTILYDYW